MKEFAKDLMTNRFGIILATLNVCYLVSRKFVYFVFSHSNGEECVIFKHQVVSWMKLHYAETILSINSPAALASLIQGKFTHAVFPDFCSYTHAKFQIIFLVFFIIFQWLFIGWAAKTIARAIRPNQS